MLNPVMTGTLSVTTAAESGPNAPPCTRPPQLLTDRSCSFAGFIETTENRAALAAVRALRQRAAVFNTDGADHPLYLHGPAGCGKSHLTTVLVDELIRHRPDATAIIAPSDDRPALDRCLAALDEEQGQLADLIVVEDIQRLAHADTGVLAALVDGVDAAEVPMVVTALTGPAELDIPARLVSRLAGGLVVGMETPGPIGRRLILQAMTDKRTPPLPMDVADWLAEHLPGPRRLVGALATLNMLELVEGGPLTVERVAACLGDDHGRPDIERIMCQVGRHFHVEPRRLRSSSRGHDVLLPRQVGMFLARELTALSLEQIGASFGGRDHSTVLHACRKVEEARLRDPAMAGTLRRLAANLVA